MKNLKNSVAFLISVLFFAVTALFLYTSTQLFIPVTENIKDIASEILTSYLLAFETVSILLVVALIGAFYMAEKGESE